MTERMSSIGKLILVLMGLGPVAMALLSSFAMPWATLGAYAPLMWIGGGAFLLAETLVEDYKRVQKKEPVVIAELLVGMSWLVIGAAVLANTEFILNAIAGYHAMFLALGSIFIVCEVYSNL